MRVALASLIIALSFGGTVLADFTATGNVIPQPPADVTAWTIGGLTPRLNLHGPVSSLKIENGCTVNMIDWQSIDGWRAGTSIGFNANSTFHVDGSGSAYFNRGDFHLGHGNGSGVLRITNGGHVTTQSGSFADLLPLVHIGGVYGSGDGDGEVLITGSGSMMTVGGQATLVGAYRTGRGKLKIEEGGGFESNNRLELFEGSSIRVSGAGSSLKASSLELRGEVEATDFGAITSDADVYVRGTTTLKNGATLTTDGDVRVVDTLNLHVGQENMVTAGRSFIVDGEVHFIAEPNLEAGTYTPISVGQLLIIGSSRYSAQGGTWSLGEFTVPAPVVVSAPVSDQDLSGQRYRWRRPPWRRWSWSRPSFRSSFSTAIEEDSGLKSASISATSIEGGDSLDISFSSDAGVASINSTELTATGPINGELALLAYEVSTDLENSTATLSFQLGAGFSEDHLKVWRSSDGGSSWNEVSDFTYGGEWLSLQTDVFGQFAVTTDQTIGSSKFSVIDIENGTTPTLTFNTEVETLYSVWSSDSPAGPWICIAQLAGDGLDHPVADPQGLRAKQFYQVREN